MSGGRKKSGDDLQAQQEVVHKAQELAQDKFNKMKYNLRTLHSSLKSYSGIHKLIVGKILEELVMIPPKETVYFEKNMKALSGQMIEAMVMKRSLFGRKKDIDLSNSIISVLANVNEFNQANQKRLQEESKLKQLQKETKKPVENEQAAMDFLEAAIAKHEQSKKQPAPKSATPIKVEREYTEEEAMAILNKLDAVTAKQKSTVVRSPDVKVTSARSTLFSKPIGNGANASKKRKREDLDDQLDLRRDNPLMDAGLAAISSKKRRK